MTKRRKQIQDELIIVSHDVLQKPPYTVSTIEAGLPKDGPYTVTAFAKAHPKDKFSPEMGITISGGRALAEIARRIEKAERREEFVNLASRLREGAAERAHQEAQALGAF